MGSGASMPRPPPRSTSFSNTRSSTSGASTRSVRVDPDWATTDRRGAARPLLWQVIPANLDSDPNETLVQLHRPLLELVRVRDGQHADRVRVRHERLISEW